MKVDVNCFGNVVIGLQMKIRRMDAQVSAKNVKKYGELQLMIAIELTLKKIIHWFQLRSKD